MIDTYKKKIISFYETHRRMPGYAEIMNITGFKSKNAKSPPPTDKAKIGKTWFIATENTKKSPKTNKIHLLAKFRDIFLGGGCFGI